MANIASILFDSVAKKLQTSKDLIRVAVYIMPWFVPPIEAFLRMTIILLARSCPR